MSGSSGEVWMGISKPLSSLYFTPTFFITHWIEKVHSLLTNLVDAIIQLLQSLSAMIVSNDCQQWLSAMIVSSGEITLSFLLILCTSDWQKSWGETQITNNREEKWNLLLRSQIGRTRNFLRLLSRLFNFF